MLRSLVGFFASRPLMTVALWAATVVFGVLAYTVLLPREGFPPVDIPVALANGAYLVDDAEKVDEEVARPLGEAIATQPGVDSVETYSRTSSFTIVVQLDAALTSADGVAAVEQAMASVDLPPEAAVEPSRIDASKFLEEYDLLVGVYGDSDASAEELEAAAAAAAPLFAEEADVARAEVVELLVSAIDPATGEQAVRETDFNLFTAPDENGELGFRPSIAVGIVAEPGVDSLTIRDAADSSIERIRQDGALPDGYEAVVAIDFATQIRQQIGSLQNNVLTGVLAVALVALLLISWRASVVTAVFIVTVLATTVGVLYLIGISLNTISLFGIILALGLFVDDAIVITESIVASKRAGDDDLTIIRRAINRVGAASVSGTLTTVLVFAPMLAITGILGSFIRVLPLTVILSLGVSVLLSFVFIPVACRFLVLPAKSDRGPLSGIESKLAAAIASMPSATGIKGAIRTTLAVGLSLAMTLVGLLVFAPRVGFNIFPPGKDTTVVGVDISYPPGTEIEDARRIALEVNQLAADALGEDLVEGYTYAGNVRSATTQLQLSAIGGRPTAPELIEQRLDPLAEEYPDARVTFTQISAGPPEATFPFLMQVYGEDPEILMTAATSIAADLDGATIERPNGTTFSVLETQVVYTDSVVRIDGRRKVEVRARFDADDVTTTTSSAQTFVEDRYSAEDIEAFGLAPDALQFDLGFESDNQESFASLPIAFLVALGSMLVLLVFQFRSLAQWLLVFLAIPFSFFGVFGGLLLTGNVISFFVMLGLIGLVGIAVNNTILLVDYANQERRAGLDRREAIEHAIKQRFRPLVATSFTTVAGLLPLALSDPFWEALGMTIIFGLLSSTFLVLVSFPFYYLGMEALRDRFVTPWRRRLASGDDQPDDDRPQDSHREPVPVA